MRRTLPILSILLLFGAAMPRVLAAQDAASNDGAADRMAAARDAAEAWLDLIAAAEYEASWRSAGTQFKQAITAEGWGRQAADVYRQVGALERRRLESTEHTTRLPDAPPGEYMILTYASVFDFLPDGREIVVTMREDDRWKVVGYFVQPAQGG